MRPHELRKKLRSIGIGDRVPVITLAGAIAADRGRPLRLKALNFPSGMLTAAVLQTPHADICCYPATEWPVDPLHAIAHELGHLLAGHEGRPLGSDDVVKMLAPDIDPTTAKRVLTRCGFGNTEEREAERIAMHLVLDHLTTGLPDVEWIAPHGLHADLAASLGVRPDLP